MATLNPSTKQKTVSQLQKDMKKYQEQAKKYAYDANFQKTMAKMANEVVAEIKREISRKKKS